MTVRIRLRRTGRRNRPCHRLCVIDQRTRRDGRVLENLGLYDPLAPKAEEQLQIKGDRIVWWVANGASLSETAASLVKRAGIELPAKDKKPRERKRQATETRAKAKFERNARVHKAKKERATARKAAAAAAKAAEKSE
ncbi:MAG: 30S ribosomal protein S16 [Planctomycetota bacterium]